MNPCNGCPFNDGITHEATQAQNYGCLPSSFDMVQHFDENGISISCHMRADRLCRGLAKVRPEATTKPIRDYSDWYHSDSK